LVSSFGSYFISYFGSYLTSSFVSYFNSTFGDSGLGSAGFYLGSFMGCFPVFLAVLTGAGAGFVGFLTYTGFFVTAGVLML
jgi:hypothetical protein